MWVGRKSYNSGKLVTSNLLPEAATASGGWDGYMEISKNRARVDGFLDVMPRMSKVAMDSVMMEARRRGWILICAVTIGIPTNSVLVRRFLWSASLLWVMNLSTLLLVSVWMS